MRPGRVLAAALVSSALVVALAGCQSAFPSAGGPEDVAHSRKARLAEITEEFNQQHDKAELQAAMECYQRKDFSGCSKALKPLLKRNPDHIEGHLLLAEALVAQDRCQEAIAKLEPLAERHPQHARLQHAMGLLWDNAGDAERAIGYYQRAVQQEPANKEYQLSYGTAARAAANVSLASVLEEPPSHPLGPSEVEPAGHDESVEQAASAAVGEATRPAAAAPVGDADPRLNAAMEALRRGSRDEALPLLEKVIAANPQDPQIPISAAVAALHVNRPDVAIALVKPALDRFPKSASLYRILAAAHYRCGDYAASQIAAQQALSLDKSSALSYFLMGCTLSKLGQTEAAAEAFGRARQIDPRFAVSQ